MKLIVAIVFAAIVGCCMAENCQDFKAVVDFSTVVKNIKTWIYSNTNHEKEECNYATYTPTTDKNGNWDVRILGNEVHMHCPMVKNGETSWSLQVRETGSTYNVTVAHYDEDKSFCWIGCSLDGKLVTFWHCFVATKDENSKKNFNTIFEDIKLTKDEKTEDYPNVKDSCKY